LKSVLRQLVAALLAMGLHVAVAQAQDSASPPLEAFSAARQSILEGHVKDGIAALAALTRTIDATKQPDVYWRASSTLAEFLHQTENYSEESQVLFALVSANIANANSLYFQAMQLLVGRNLAFTGKADEGLKILRALTGGDARWVLTPLQRSAARVLSTIELDRGNVSQAAIWMRRAVIGAMVDKGAGSEEIVDTLTDYATYLRRTRRLPEAIDVLSKLAAVYDASFPRRGPKSLHYTSELLQALRAVNLQVADVVYQNLKNNAAAVDVVANDVRAQLFYQDLYRAAAKPSANGEPPISARLEQIAAQYPDWIKQTEPRIVFSYFALLADDADLAEKFVTIASTDTLAPQFSGYQSLLKSYIAARRDQFDASYELVETALEKITLFYQSFADESASRLPAISFEERLVMGAVLGRLVPHISTPKQADVVFRLQQFLNRDKSKLSLSAKVARQLLTSDLQKEDVRSRDRLKDLRERIMGEAVERLLARTLPIREYAPSKDNDYAFLTRLEDVEEKIVDTAAELHRIMPAYDGLSGDSSVGLAEVRRLLKPDEALVVHVALAGRGLVAACITSGNSVFDYSPIAAAELQQLVIDAKLVSAALRGTHAPSIEQDSGFPVDNSFHLYQVFFGKLATCLNGRRHILLAPDADFLALPWNALLTERPSGEIRHRDARWLPRSYALSLLPSVGSLRQLRLNLPASQARHPFLGIGDPDFRGEPEKSAQIALASVLTARGAASREAIAGLPRLPETSAELHDVARALGASGSDLILGREATERGVRSRSLEDYRVISFATHAIVAGEIEGATEPALVLSPGQDQDNSKNDGLLTANEIADLALDANLVILSACNTAAPDGRLGGRGLSGLADALFFAGARAVAVTQWSVFSDAARRIGSGMVARSVGPAPTGIAEGLRRTMVEFIDTAREDYLAHPRFWASYVIAGDGAVSPRDGASEDGKDRRPIELTWDYAFPSPEKLDVMGLTQAADQTTGFAIGIEAPAAGEKRAGSYIARLDKSGHVDVVGLDHEMAANGIVAFGDKLGVTGYYPFTCTSCPQQAGNSSAVFKLIDGDGREIWKYIQQSAQWIFAVGMTKTSQGYGLVAFETDYGAASKPSSIVLTSVSEHGIVLKQNRFVIPLKHPNVTQPVIRSSDGNLVVAVNGDADTPPPQSGVWMNPVTGTKRYTCADHSFLLLSIDPNTGAVAQQANVAGGGILTRLKEAGGKLYGSVNVSNDCRFETNVRLIEIGRDFATRTIFESDNVNSVEISDFAVTGQAFVLAGRIHSFLPFVLANRTLSPEELRHFQVPNFDDSFWDKNDNVANALVMVVGQDGKLQGDRVFHDIRNRSFSRLISDTPGDFIAAGSTSGDHGWVAGLRLADRWR
jgi:CHAT domain-containing protein